MELLPRGLHLYTVCDVLLGSETILPALVELVQEWEAMVTCSCKHLGVRSAGGV